MFSPRFSDPARECLPAANRHYQWQLYDGQRWIRINNDHVIEAHYCQPGAKGIKIFTEERGPIFIDFDNMEVLASQVRRQTFLADDEVEEKGWYYFDNRCWYEYGSQGSSSCRSSVTSSDLELQYTSHQSNIRFTVGNGSYSLDFRAMTQTNLTTGVQRRVRRRPKLNSRIKSHSPAGPFQALPSQQTTPNTGGGWKWQFQDNEGVWTEYSLPNCSVDSDGIERLYQSNPHGQVPFTAGRFSYTLNFQGMFQTNNRTGTQRSVKRVKAADRPTYQSAAFSIAHQPATPQAVTLSPPSTTGHIWEFMADEGIWTEYQTPNCSVGSAEIERIYQMNPQGQTKFTAWKFSYTLNFAGMYQINDTLGTRRAVRRLLKNGLSLNAYDAETEGVRGTPTYSSYAGTQCRWQYQDVDGVWRDFAKERCSVSSLDIENSFQQNPRGTMNFSTNSFQYVLDFVAMTQQNLSTSTVRKIRRLQE
ncbi:hypothetical protein GJAV_G00161010 [Gymnothorax javanicus]|nr:hypothetical protein GJAV_G00161010 [Gymnothorax javanicus]